MLDVNPCVVQSPIIMEVPAMNVGAKIVSQIMGGVYVE